MKKYLALLWAGMLLATLFTVNGTVRAASTLEDPSFQEALGAWDRHCAEAIAAFGSLQPEQADKLFFSEESPFAQLQDSKQLHSLEAFALPSLDRRDERKETEEDKALFKELGKHGLLPESVEGNPFLLVSDAFLLQKAGSSFSPDLQAFQKVREKQPYTFVADGGLSSSLEEMGEWAVQWEDFLNSQPSNTCRAEAEKMYQSLMTLMLMCDLDNTPAFPRFAGRKMNAEWRDSLHKVAAGHAGTHTANLVSDFLAAIQKDGFKLSKANEKRFQERIRTAFTPVHQEKAGGGKEDRLVGRHGFRLQWIEGGGRGTATIMRTDKGLFVDARQEARGDYVTLRGELQMVNPKELVITGEIVTRVSHIAGGNACPRQGTFTFKAKGDRKFWRLQEMQNPCSEVVDYVDIFF